MDVKQLTKSLLWNVALCLVIFLLSYTTAQPLGEFAKKYVEVGGGSWLNLSSTIGLIDSFLFFIPFLFISFGDKYSSYWLALLLIPVALFDLYISISILYFPILLMLVGSALGFTLRKLKEKFWPRMRII